MNKYLIKYYHSTTGEYPHKIVEAEDKDKAIYIYYKSCGFKHKSFEKFLQSLPETRYWTTTAIRLDTLEILKDD